MKNIFRAVLMAVMVCALSTVAVAASHTSHSNAKAKAKTSTHKCWKNKKGKTVCKKMKSSKHHTKAAAKKH